MSTQDIPTKTITLSADQWQTILDTVESCWDEKPRPTGEGWQSGRLSAASAALSAELAKPEPAELVASLPKLVTSPTAIRPVDRYELGDAIRRAWLKHGQDSWSAIADEVFAALAQPEPVAPTDEEIMELMPQQMRDDLAAAARAMIGFENPKAAAACRIILNRHAVDHARAVLARWGTPANNTREEN
jgi:hypothetical protein